MTGPWQTSIRAAHILASSVWLGVLLYNAIFLLPAVQDSGAAGSLVMRRLVRRRHLPLFIVGAVFISLLTGGALLREESAAMPTRWLHSRRGILIGGGCLLTALSLLCSQAVAAPAAQRLGETTAAVRRSGGCLPDEAMTREMRDSMSRLLRGTQLAAALLTIAALAMAVAR